MIDVATGPKSRHCKPMHPGRFLRGVNPYVFSLLGGIDSGGSPR